MMSKLANDFYSRLELYSQGIIPKPVREFKFHETRGWRFDFAWPYLFIAVEVEGGQWVRGRHTRGAGFANDCEKYNAAVERGWRVFRFSTSMVTDPKYYAPLFRALGVVVDNN
jgi:very-short-patch-repair endonuclease